MAAGDGTPDPGPAPAIPDAYRAFTEALLGRHRRREFLAFDPPRAMCVACGVLDGECPIRNIARNLGLLPEL